MAKFRLPSNVRRRVVLDTNVLVSLYVFSDSRFAPLRAKIQGNEWTAITNDTCLDEFRRVLSYPNFSLTADQQDKVLKAYRSEVESLPDSSAESGVRLPRCSDRDDQKFLELARDSDADWLITADKALLRLARRDRLRGLFCILTPEQTLEELQTG